MRFQLFSLHLEYIKNVEAEIKREPIQGYESNKGTEKKKESQQIWRVNNWRSFTYQEGN